MVFGMCVSHSFPLCDSRHFLLFAWYCCWEREEKKYHTCKARTVVICCCLLICLLCSSLTCPLLRNHSKTPKPTHNKRAFTPPSSERRCLGQQRQQRQSRAVLKGLRSPSLWSSSSSPSSPGCARVWMQVCMSSVRKNIDRKRLSL